MKSMRLSAWEIDAIKGALPSVSTWQFFRFLRNNLAHDYPDNPDRNRDNLNALFERWREFATLYEIMKKTYAGRFLGQD